MGKGMDMAFDMVGPVVMGLMLGLWLDNLFHTAPWLMVAFLLLGVATGIYSVISQANARYESQKRKKESELKQKEDQSA